MEPIERALHARSAPAIAGLLTAALCAFVWGSLDEPGAVHDEIAYLLQAGIYTLGRWSSPAPPLGEFFEQYHVLVTPVLAAKYPPGHALLLAPGVALGLRGLGVVALDGVAGGLLFALARRLAGGRVAALAWLFWATAPAGLAWRTSYFSQTTTTALWLAALFALLGWRDSGRRRWLALAGAALGFMALTRPLTALALGLPVVAVVVARVATRREWRAAAVFALAGGAVLALLPVSNAAVTGDWRVLPYSLHTRMYLPFARFGFGLDPTPPERELPPDMETFRQAWEKVHAAHTLAALPATLADRLLWIGGEMWGPGGWRRPLALLALVGLLALPRAALVAAAGVLTLFAAHVPYAHTAHGVLYYHESQPLLAFLTALGWSEIAGRARASWPAPSPGPVLFRALGLALLGAVGVLAARDVLDVRRSWPARADWRKTTDALFARIPDARAVVFIRYSPRHNPDRPLVDNPPDHRTARLWRVYDRGDAENLRLLALAPERTPYLYDEATGTLSRRFLVPAR